MQIVLATNQVNQLDSAVLDRMNELLEIPLPEFPEREAMLKQYILRGGTKFIEQKALLIKFLLKFEIFKVRSQ